MAEPPVTEQTTNPKHLISAYLVLAFGLSSIFWYIIAARPQPLIDIGIPECLP